METQPESASKPRTSRNLGRVARDGLLVFGVVALVCGTSIAGLARDRHQAAASQSEGQAINAQFARLAPPQFPHWDPSAPTPDVADEEPAEVQPAEVDLPADLG